MFYLFFDTETTGLPRNYHAPISDLDNWPRLVQIAWLLASDEGDIISQKEYIIKPKDFIIPEEASNIHGIDNAKAQKDGSELEDVLNIFNQDLKIKDLSLVAHNISFDQAIVGSEFLRISQETNFFDLNPICTMKSSIDFCNLPNKRFPKLSFLHFKLFEQDFDNAHNALADVIACYKCFFELRRRGILS